MFLHPFITVNKAAPGDMFITRLEQPLSMVPGSKARVRCMADHQFASMQRFKAKAAVRNVTLDLHVGEVTALLGHNGAGKPLDANSSQETLFMCTAAVH